MFAGYADPSTGQFRAAVESADKLHRHRSPTDHIELRQAMSATQVLSNYSPLNCPRQALQLPAHDSKHTLLA